MYDSSPVPWCQEKAPYNARLKVDWTKVTVVDFFKGLVFVINSGILVGLYSLWRKIDKVHTQNIVRDMRFSMMWKQFVKEAREKGIVINGAYGEDEEGG